MPSPRLLASLALVALAGCGSSSKNTSCDPVAQSGCSGAQVCESVQGGQPACFDPVVLKGKVFDLAAPAGGLDAARVVALDVNGAPATGVATSAATTGLYSLAIPSSARKADGTPVGVSLTLRADRAGYDSFPSGLRVALPISTASATHTGGQWVVQTLQTDIGLAAIASAPAGVISGSAARPASGGGVLVVAENTATKAGYTAIPGTDGAYKIFNVPDGTYELRGFAAGANYVPVTVTVASGVATPTSAALVLATGAAAATATVNGSVNMVAGTTWPTTSVLLVVASTYDASEHRGVAPPGLRAGDVSNTWTIAGIPDGHYRVLAAFETDYLVRDPSDIGGTAVLEFQVVNGQPLLMDGTTSAATMQVFKITGAVRLLGPMQDATGACATLASPPADPTTIPAGACTTKLTAPEIAWTVDSAYSAADTFEVTVADDAGVEVWKADVAKGTSSVAYGATGTGITTVTPAAALVAGHTYQARIAAKKSTQTLSVSEDLLGVFTYQP
ncbi:MAG TPA: carboxypeptidase regulatory-like domain-containing protein [Anaeromyxobacteraceae bacterium]|nr:carboxypeptidase regulatory-like domain-containing protein [Anaeromyxobacteraceae bacterium]